MECQLSAGGNLWSDYHGSDDYQGPEQNVLGADGFGDLPYEIDSSSLDRYPIMAIRSGRSPSSIRLLIPPRPEWETI